MLYEGGIRVPLLIRWPGQRAGCRDHAPVILRDLVPTILEASATPHVVKDFDAVAISSDGQALADDRSLHWHFPVYLERDSSVEGPWRTTPVAAVRKGPYKLIEFFEDERLELYDLRHDPSESENLIMTHPDVVTDLRSEMARWRRDVGAKLPSPFIVTKEDM
jgi:arylsulfatase A-like enzyme